MRDFLVKILTEAGQELPDFWDEFKPADEQAALDFNDDSGAEEEEAEQVNGGTGDAWGNSGVVNDSNDAWGAGTTVAPVAHAADVWGTTPSAAVDNGAW